MDKYIMVNPQEGNTIPIANYYLMGKVIILSWKKKKANRNSEIPFPSVKLAEMYLTNTCGCDGLTSARGLTFRITSLRKVHTFCPTNTTSRNLQSREISGQRGKTQTLCVLWLRTTVLKGSSQEMGELMSMSGRCSHQLTPSGRCAHAFRRLVCACKHTRTFFYTDFTIGGPTEGRTFRSWQLHLHLLLPQQRPLVWPL